MEIKVYSPRENIKLKKLYKDIAKGFFEGHELAMRFFIRDLKASYQRSLLGILWLFIPALVSALVWVFLNNQQVITVKNAPMDYAAFTISGTLLWSLFTESINKPMQRYQGAMSMMSKLNFPKEALILVSIYDMLFSMVLKLIVLIPILWVLGYVPDWQFIPALFWILYMILMGLSIGILITPVGLLYSDVGRFINIALPFLMFMTPVVYPLSKSGILLDFQYLNPVTPFLERARSYIGGYDFVMDSSLVIWSIITIIIMLVGLAIIRIAMPVIIERAGS